MADPFAIDPRFMSGGEFYQGAAEGASADPWNDRQSRSFAPGTGVFDRFGRWLTGDFARSVGLAPQQIQQSTPDMSVSQIPGYQGFQDQLGTMMGQDRNRAFSPELRAGQNQLASQLWGQVRGTEPSLAQAQLQKGTDANIAQAMAMARSQRGLGAAAQMRMVGNQRALAGQQMAQDAGILRLQEQAAAQQQLSGLYNQMGGQDLQMQQMNDQQTRFYLSQGIDLAKAQQLATADMERFRVSQANALASAQASENARAGGALGNFISGLAQMGAQFATGAGGGGGEGGGGETSMDAGQQGKYRMNQQFNAGRPQSQGGQRPSYLGYSTGEF